MVCDIRCSLRASLHPMHHQCGDKSFLTQKRALEYSITSNITLSSVQIIMASHHQLDDAIQEILTE